jgi:hypothetical protein
MASGIEKQSFPPRTVEYLGQNVTHMWRATAFGHPVRNLVVDPPEILAPGGWTWLLRRIGTLLDELKNLGASAPPDAEPWWRWRASVIGPDGWLRRACASTLAETRLPNNDVTLWDQSYVAAALFKSAAAGLVLSPASNWENLNLKSQTRWRVLTVGFGTEHYEARAVRIGDWVGARQQIESLFDDVCRLVEVDLAVGSLIYRDDDTLAFTLPGLRFDGTQPGSLDDTRGDLLRVELEKRIDEMARERKLETPPVCRVSTSTRSLIPMASELQAVRRAVAIPVHRPWAIPATDETRGHVCPVCRVRFNGQPERRLANVSKQRACKVCHERRKGRLDAWLASGSDTIWLSEVADENDRIALITLSFDMTRSISMSVRISARTPACRTCFPRSVSATNGGHGFPSTAKARGSCGLVRAAAPCWRIETSAASFLGPGPPRQSIRRATPPSTAPCARRSASRPGGVVAMAPQTTRWRWSATSLFATAVTSLSGSRRSIESSSAATPATGLVVSIAWR